MNKYKILSIIALSIVWSLTLIAKEKPKQEFSAWLGGGLSSLQYKTSVGNQKGNIGGTFGVGYNYFISDKYSIGTGIELSSYNSKANINSLSQSYTTQDTEGQSFVFKSAITDYEETQHAMYLSIPLMFQYQMAVGKEKMLYVALGGKVGFPTSSKYKTTIASVTNTGSFNYEGIDYSEGFEFLGLGTFKDKKMENDLDLKIACMLSIEAGLKFKLSDNLALYMGGYFDYGLNNINKSEQTATIIAFNSPNPKDFTNNSIFASKNQSEVLVNKVVPMAVGLKLRLALGK